MPHSDADGGFSRGTAFHEAGHAIVAWCLGHTVHAVRVEADDDSGHTKIVGPVPWRDELTILTAGYTAEKHFDCWGPEQAPRCDHKRIYTVMTDNGVDPHNDGGLKLELEQRALSILQAHKDGVVRVVDALVKTGHVDGDEFLRLMR